MGVIILLIVMIIFGPPLLLVIIGASLRGPNKESAKMLYILAAVWLIVGGGICATILNSGT